MSHLSLLRRLGTFRTTSSLRFVLWPHRFSRASLLSLCQCNRLHDRSRTCLRNCVGHAIVQADNAPDCGVAQGVIHGVPVRHGEKQEEEEGEVEQEVERNKEEKKSNNNAHVHG